MESSKNLSNAELAEAIRAVSVSKAVPITKRLRALFVELESALDAGKSADDIVKALALNGFVLSRAHFQSAMSKIRAERGLINKKTHTSKPERVETKNSSTSPKLSVGAKPVDATAPTAAKETETPGTGIVDIFAVQAEREAKKESGAKFQKIPRR